VTEATLPALEPSTEPPRPSRVWRMVMIVVAFQLVIIAAGMVFFTAMGFANDGTGGCGGG
jgi:hypothetical protein